MVTCYDYWSAQILEKTDIDCLLVGDSLAMVMHGYESTVFAEIELMALHVRAVAKGAPGKFIVGDMPFLTTRKGLQPTMDAVQTLMQAGANAVKVEGELGQRELIAHIVESGVPVMGHLGLTPQSVNGFGGIKYRAGTRLMPKRFLFRPWESPRLAASLWFWSAYPRVLPGASPELSRSRPSASVPGPIRMARY